MEYQEINNFFDKFEKRFSKEPPQTIRINQIDINFRDFHEYLSTIDYKFDCCKMYLEKITNYYDSDVEKVKKNIKDILNLKVSLEFISWIDGFLFQMKSCLDVMAQLINLIYGINMDKNRVNIYNIISNFPDTQNNLYIDLIGHKDKWIDQMNKYRKFITHHKLLTTGSNLNSKKGEGVTFSPHILPDDPSVNPKTYRSKIDLKEFFDKCQQGHLKLILSFYKEMERLL